MKKSILISFFDSTNMGDRLICKRMVDISQKHYDVECVDFISLRRIDEYDVNELIALRDSKKNFFREKIGIVKFLRSAKTYIKSILYVKKHINSIFNNIPDAEMLFIGGGNMLMELSIFPSYVSRVYHILKEAKKRNLKVALIYTGVGPLKNRLHRWYVKRIFELCSFISVRDALSHEISKEIAPTVNVKIWYDPVLSLSSQASESKTKTIGICVFAGPVSAKREDVISSYIKLINKLCDALPTHKILLFSSEAGDYRDVNEVMSGVDAPAVSVVNIESTDGFLRMFGKIDMLISARMHGIIVALVNRLPVIGLSWQKKFDGLAQIVGIEDKMYAIDELQSHIDCIVDDVTRFDQHSDECRNRLNKIMTDIQCESEKQFELFTQFF